MGYTWAKSIWASQVGFNGLNSFLAQFAPSAFGLRVQLEFDPNFDQQLI